MFCKWLVFVLIFWKLRGCVKICWLGMLCFMNIWIMCMIYYLYEWILGEDWFVLFDMIWFFYVLILVCEFVGEVDI